MALCVARGGQSPDLKPSHANHILMTQGTEKQDNKGEKVLELMAAMLALSNRRPKRLGDSRESSFPHQREKALSVPRASEPKSPFFLFWGPWLDQWGMGSNGLQTGYDLLSKF